MGKNVNKNGESSKCNFPIIVPLVLPCFQALTLSDLSLDYKLFKAETIFHFPRNCYAVSLHYINTGEHFKTQLIILYATMFISPAKECLKGYVFYITSTMHFLKWFFFRISYIG